MLKKVLIIDDDDLAHHLLTVTLTDSKFVEQVVVLTNGRDGLNYFEKLSISGGAEAPELVLLDLKLPTISGWEFLDEFGSKYQQMYPTTQFCILSNSVNPKDQFKSMDYSNVITFLDKPLVPQDLDRLKNRDELKMYFSAPYHSDQKELVEVS
ncbi:response regulator [Telluribacter humicola]|uniref:response regulator n=1 Tax=Telluribacter humicola TaxID=1720261 RepID=UPI001A96AF07|nr:response regulator [Telluribacter humicola]